MIDELKKMKTSSMNRLLKNTGTAFNMKRKKDKEIKTISKLLLVILVILVAGCSQIDWASQDNRRIGNPAVSFLIPHENTLIRP